MYPCQLGVFPDNIFYSVGAKIPFVTDVGKAEEQIRGIVCPHIEVFLQCFPGLFGSEYGSDLGSFPSDVELMRVDVDVLFF